MKPQATKKTATGLIQVIKFCFVGAFNTIVNYVVYTFCYYVLHTSAYVGNIFGFIISVFSAFLLQNRFVFKESEEAQSRVWWQVLIKTYLSYAFTGLLLTELLLLFWLNVLDIGQYLGFASNWLAELGITMAQGDIAVSLAPFLNMFFTIPINFLLNKFWAYRQKSAETKG